MAARVLAAPCPGDCNKDGVVTVAEVINGVNILLGTGDIFRCTACDLNGDGVVTVDEIIKAVIALLDGCPATPTPTGTPNRPSPTPVVTATCPPNPPAESCQVDGVICTVAGTCRAQFDGDGRQALDTSFYFPIAVAFEPSDGLPLILDWNNLRLRRIDADGTIETIMGTGAENSDLPMEGGLAIDTSLHHANDIEYDAAGSFFLSGDHLPIVMRVDPDGRVHLVAGTQTTGYSGDGGPALMAQLTTPYGVEPDDQGGFYVSDVDANVVRYVGADAKIQTVAGDGTQNCCAPGGLDPCPPDTVSCYTGDHGLGTKARLWGPARVKLGPDGALYFCETRNHVVRRLHPDGTIDTFAGNGTRGYSGDHAPATQAQLNGPYDIRFAPNGDAYVADTNNQVIRRIDSNGIITTVVGNGMTDFAGDGGPAANSALFRPSSIIFDREGSMWIADTSNQRVRRVWHYLDTIPPS